jgi:hypothetical protein
MGFGPFGNFDTPRYSTHFFLRWDVLRQETHIYLCQEDKALGAQLAVRQGTLAHDLMRTVLADGAMGAEQPLRCVYDMLDTNSRADTMQEYRRSGRWNLKEEQKQQLLDYEKLEHLVLVAERKQVFMTVNLQLGMSPSVIKPGDCIAIIHGSKVPCVLRQVKKRSNEYRIISQCYLDGWMYGRTKTIRSHPHGKWMEEEPDEFILV